MKLTKKQREMLERIRGGERIRGCQSNTHAGRTLEALIRKGFVTADKCWVKGEYSPNGAWWPGFIAYGIPELVEVA